VIYLVIGRRERGKTTRAYSLARKVRKRVIIDPRRMIQRADVEIVHKSMELRAALSDLYLDDAMNEVVFQPEDDDLEVAFARFITAIKEWVIAHPRTALAVVIDECSFFDLGDYRFQWLIKCTPRETVHIIITAHRPSDIPTGVRAIADHWLIFATTQEHDLKAIEQRSGSPRVVAAVRTLKDREYVHWNDAKGQHGIERDASAWYFAMRMRTEEPSKPIVDDPQQDNDGRFDYEDQK
jgi:predicted transcriptional regulator